MSRVSQLCPVLRAQPGAYPPETQNRTLRRRAGEQKFRPEPSTAGSVEKGNAANVGNTETGKIRRFWTLRQESRRKPRCRARPLADTSARSAGSLGICEDVPKAAKISSKALQYEKSPPFQGKRRGSNEKYGVKAKFALWITPECKQHVLLLR